MDRLARWLLPVLLLIEVTLAPSGRLDVCQTVDVPAVVNFLTLAVLGRLGYLMRRRYQHARGAGRGMAHAAAEALAVVLPGVLAARLVARARPIPRLSMTQGETAPLTLPQS